MIPKEIYEKYHLADITEYETESEFYETFLIQTDFIPNKILEGVATSEEYANELLTYDINEVGDPQLYRVVQAHTSQEDWKPDSTPALYTAIGLNPQGYPTWSRPTGAHDAYNTGDIVDYNGTLYKSLIDGNVWSPEEYPAGWEKVTV